MIDVTYSNGTLALTPDHVLLVDGAFVAARSIRPGSRLSPTLSNAHHGLPDGAPASDVIRIRHSTAPVISPLTVSGLILAAGPTGAPIVASVYPDVVVSPRTVTL